MTDTLENFKQALDCFKLAIILENDMYKKTINLIREGVSFHDACFKTFDKFNAATNKVELFKKQLIEMFEEKYL